MPRRSVIRKFKSTSSSSHCVIKMDEKEASEFFKEVVRKSIPRDPEPDATTGYLYFETPDFSVTSLSQEAYIRSHLGPTMSFMTEVIPLYYKGVVLDNPRSMIYRHFHSYIYNQLKEQWVIFQDIAPILTKDRIMNRFMACLRKSQRYTSLPPRQYNFHVALCINFMLYFTWKRPQEFSPTNPESIRLLLGAVDDVWIYFNLESTRKLAEQVGRSDGTIDGIMLRVIYTVFSGLYFDNMSKHCMQFTDKVVVK